MQKRFCNCGQTVWVLYIPRDAQWKPFFYNRSERHGQRVEVCPHCGAPLSIHILR